MKKPDPYITFLEICTFILFVENIFIMLLLQMR